MKPLWVESVGAITAVGMTAGETMGSILTGRRRPSAIPLVDPDGRPLRVCAATLATGLGGVGRLVALARLALTECATDAPAGPLPVVLCCPSPTALHYDPNALAQALAPISGVALHRTTVVAGGGHAAIGTALRLAGELLEREEHGACYVVGVDSLLDPQRLRSLAATHRIVARRSPDGFIPGEAAVALRLSRSPSRHARIVGVGLGKEQATRDSGKVTGRVQADVIREVLARTTTPIEDVTLLVADFSGERHRFAEVALARTRLRPARDQTLETVGPGASVGEVGCAFGALAVAYAAFALERGWEQTTRGRAAIYVGADDGALRTAVLLGGTRGR